MNNESEMHIFPDNCPDGFPKTYYFLNPMVSLENIELFHNLTPEVRPVGRPLISVNSVTDAIGVLSLNDRLHPNPSIGMSGQGMVGYHLVDSRPDLIGWKADARFLQRGFFDAVVASASILRTERKLQYLPWDQDLLDSFDAHIGKTRALRVIVSRAGFSKEDWETFPLFCNPDERVRVLIATTSSGLAKINSEINEKERNTNVDVRSFGESDVDVVELVRAMGQEYGIQYIDLQGGGQLNAAFARNKLIDIFRKTTSPLIAGSLDSNGNPRPQIVTAYFGTMDLISMRLRKTGICFSHKLEIYDNLIYSNP